MFEHLTEEDVQRMVETIDRQYGASVTGMFTGAGCGLDGFSEIAEQFDDFPTVLIVSACEGFRLLAKTMYLVHEAGGSTSVVDPFRPNGIITGITIDESTVGALSEGGVTIERLTDFIQTGVGSESVTEVMEHIITNDPELSVEFIHVVIHGVAQLLIDTEGVDYSKLSDFDIDPNRMSAGWN